MHISPAEIASLVKYQMRNCWSSTNPLEMTESPDIELIFPLTKSSQAWKAITTIYNLPVLADLSSLQSYLIVFHHHKFPESLQSS